MQKNISVIIPIKNQQSALIQTLKMFNKQVKPCDFEVIVVNDDQIDLNEVHLKLMVMPKYSLRIVNSGKCNGRAAARNTGVRLSNGDIIVFCDADRIKTANLYMKISKSAIRQTLLSLRDIR